MAVSYSYDTIYKIYAYRENAVRIVATQGEGFAGAISSLGNNDLVKSPRFQLRDDRGVVVIPSSGSPRVELAIIKSDGTEDLLDCSIVDRSTGVVACPIRKSLTDVPGIVKGEIRLITTNAVTKFYGINFFIHDGVSDSAAAQSSRFSDLIAALQQVGLIIEGGSEGTVSLDTVIQANGTKPVASGIIYNYLASNYVKYVTVSDATIDDAVELNTLYYGHINGMYSEIECVVGTSWKTQFLHRSNGVMQMRSKHKTNDAWGDWGDWSPIGTTTNINDGAITTAKLADLSVTESKVNNGAVSTDKIANGAVTEAKMSNTSISTAKVKDGAITQAKLSSDVSSLVSDVSTAMSNANGLISYVELDTISEATALNGINRIGHRLWTFKATGSLATSIGVDSPSNCFMMAYWSDGNWYQIVTVISTQKQFIRKVNTVYPTWSADSWSEIKVTSDKIANGAVTTGSLTDGAVTRAKMGQGALPSVFSYTLTSANWSSGQQTITVPNSYVASGDVVADIDFGDSVYAQLIADGCTGIYVASEFSNSTLSLVAVALGNTPTANISVQITLTPIIDLD